MNLIQRFMYGRYGWDHLNVFLLALCLIFCILDTFLRGSVFYFLYVAVFAVALYRMLSRNIPRRRAENAKFMTLAGPAIRWVKLRRTIHRDKEHRYFKCPNCGQQLRVPGARGRSPSPAATAASPLMRRPE